MANNFIGATDDTHIYNGNTIFLTSKNKYTASRVEGKLTDFDDIVDGGDGGDEELPPWVDPNVNGWRNNMLSYGDTHGDYLIANHDSEADAVLQATYYDSELVYYKIADYTGDNSWLNAADAAHEIYGNYIDDNSGALPGFWKFPYGLAERYVRDSDAAAKTLLDLIANNGSYSSDSTNIDFLRGTDHSRETAYTIDCLIAQEKIGGGSHRKYLEALVAIAINHIYTWYNDEEELCPPFMVALTCHALIKYEEYFPADFVKYVVELAADMIWERQLTITNGVYSFQYANLVDETHHTNPAPDLNLLIVSIFGYLYSKNGDQKSIRRGNLIFNGGVTSGFLGNSKQFNQSYKLSFDYLEWTNQLV